MKVTCMRLPALLFRRWTLTLGICCAFAFGLMLIWTFEIPSARDSNEPHIDKHDSEANDQINVLRGNNRRVAKVPNFLQKDVHIMPGSVTGANCPKLKPPTLTPVEKFQPFTPNNTSAYFFSAYHETRNSRNELRIIAVIERAVVRRNIWCQMWYLNGKEARVETAIGVVSTLPEGAGRRYDGCWVTCRVPNGRSGPDVVSIAPDECAQTTNGLTVVPLITKSPEKPSFALCITPFNLNYDKVDEFLEIMTLNRMFGADHAFFYNYSSSPRIRRLTEAMFHEGFATVVQWHLPMKVHIWPVPPGYVEEVKYYGQMAMLQDCLMRGMGRFKFLVFTDMDEVAVPRRHKTWLELYKAHGFLEHPAALVTFRNTFFKLEWPDDPESASDPQIKASKARSLLKTRRERTIYSPGARSKYIVDPLQIRTCGVHNIWEPEHPTGVIIVLNPDDGLIHHYRNWEGLGEKTFEIDRNMLRFKDEIIKRYNEARQKYSKLLR